jgi:DNA processing protein
MQIKKINITGADAEALAGAGASESTPNYPRLLRQISDPPRTLYYISKKNEAEEVIEAENTQIHPQNQIDLEGKTHGVPESSAQINSLLWRIANDEAMKIICIVGSRSYTEYGQLVCEKLIEGLSLYRDKIAIVSGLAIGIDSIVHRLCLRHKIPCMAIPGSGLNSDVLYPRTNVRLAEQIYENNGILISEFEPDVRANVWTFPLRNRIMAGISDLTVVIEGKKDSGTMITARLAVEYNRDVLAVPGSIFSAHSEGPRELIKQGAVPISSAVDITDALGITEYSIKEVSKSLFDSCGSEEKEILDLLDSPISTDEICQRTGFNISKVLVTISMLEMRGLVEERYGKVYSKLSLN